MEEVTILNEKQIGNYRLSEKIGSGSFSTVYRAQHILTNRSVALKVLHMQLPASEQERFIQEVQFIVSLQHRYILSVVEIGLDDGRPYFASEYISGGSLRQRLNQTRVLPLDQAFTILIQVGEALLYAHKQKIVHADLKPENILFNAEGEVVVADFGIATILSTMNATQLADLEGRSPYMAPEQFRGKVSKNSDQYALGCIAYEMLTGQLPFPTPDASTADSKHKTKQPIPPGQINAEIPTYSEQAILKALAERRSFRHDDITAFLKDLQKPPSRRRMRQQWFFAGYTLNHEKRYEEAVEAYEQAIRVDPKFAPAYANKGHALYNLNRYEEALSVYEQALRLDPDNAITHNNKAYTLYKLNRFDEALEAFEQTMSLDPGNTDAFNGKMLTLLGRQMEALGIRVPTNPDNTDANDNEENALSNLAWSQEMLETDEPALDIDANDTETADIEGNTQENINWNEEALKSFEEALDIDPQNAVALNGQGEILVRLNRYEEALSALEQALVLNPDYAMAWNNKGKALYGLERYEEAVLAFEQALTVNPKKIFATLNKSSSLDNPNWFVDMMVMEMNVRHQSLDIDRVSAYNSKGNALCKLNRYEEALLAYEQAARLDPKKAATYNNKGDALFGLEQYEQALLAYEQAARLDPENANAYNSKGNVLCHLERYEEAVETYEQALRVETDSIVIYTNKAYVLTQLERYEEAVQDYEQVLHLDPDDPVIYNNKAMALTHLNRYEEALENYKQALHLDPNNTTIYTNTGNTLSKLKRHEEALLAYEQALRLDPNDAYAYMGKVRALYDLNRIAEATELYEQAQINNADFYNHKGKMLLDLNAYEEALEAFEQALRIDPNHAEASSNKSFILALRRVNKIGKEFGLA